MSVTKTTSPFAVVAIPAHEEVDRIAACLAALATQRDLFGAPLTEGSFDVLVFANNCTDGTASAVESLVRESPFGMILVEECLPPNAANAGGARRRAMDLAADRLTMAGHLDGVILTTDADSLVAPTWIAATLRAFAGGVDAVAGYIDAHPLEMMRLGGAFLRRGRLEETYQRMIAEIDALCDPRPHDPWPNHRVAAGASLALTLTAYRAIGGLPARAVGEDVALAHALERAGYAIRHAMDVVVSTSCRFESRVQHGAAETMRQRHATLDAPCDTELEPAFHAIRRALAKGRLRRLSEGGGIADAHWADRWMLSPEQIGSALDALRVGGFEDFWADVASSSPELAAIGMLRPSDLPREIRRAEIGLRVLRRATAIAADRGGRPLR